MGREREREGEGGKDKGEEREGEEGRTIIYLPYLLSLKKGTAKKQLMTAFCFLLDSRCLHLFCATVPFSACPTTITSSSQPVQPPLPPPPPCLTHLQYGMLDLGKAEETSSLLLMVVILLQRGGRETTSDLGENLLGKLPRLGLSLIIGNYCDITFWAGFHTGFWSRGEYRLAA